MQPALSVRIVASLLRFGDNARSRRTMPQDTKSPQDGAGRPQWPGYLQIAAIVGVVAVALFFARAPERVERFAEADLTPEARKPVVRVVQPAATEQALTLKLTGSVRLKERATVISEVVGRVVWVSPKFEPGKSIDADEIFIRVDPKEFELKVEAARLEVAAREAGLKSLENRNEDTTEAAFELKKALVALELADLQLQRTNISLPYSFRVISSSVEVGELVGPAEKVGRAAVLGVAYRPESIRVAAPIEQRDLKYLAPAIGRTAQVRTKMGIYEAEVVGTSSVVAAKSRLATLYLKFPDGLPAGSLPLPHTFAEVVVAGPSHEGVYVLPEAAAQAQSRVWVVRDGVLDSAEPRTLGRVDGGWVVEAFDAGEGVVLGTLPGAREGLAVTLADSRA